MPETRIPYVDFHTTGEPFRIVVADGAHGVPELDGTTVADRRATALADQAADGPIDRARRLLCHEPRGHRDMYGGFITPPDPVESGAPAAFGVVFWHKDGYSTACGHGTIALGGPWRRGSSRRRATASSRCRSTCRPAASPRA